MDTVLVERFMENKKRIEEKIKERPPEIYKELVEIVVEQLAEKDDFGEPSFGTMDWRKIHEIDDGDYQGTLLFIIPENCYQPYDYWYVKVCYGSCSGCDTLEAIKFDTEEKDQLKDYMALALHIVQKIKKME